MFRSNLAQSLGIGTVAGLPQAVGYPIQTSLPQTRGDPIGTTLPHPFALRPRPQHAASSWGAAAEGEALKM